MWKQVSGYENVYFINEYGDLKNADGRLIKPQKRKDGYWQYQLSLNGIRKMHKVHRLVAKAFVDNPFKLNVVNHLDGNKANNYYKNLEWCTSAQNNKHSWDMGLNHNSIKQRESARRTIAIARNARLSRLTLAGGGK